MKKCTLVILFLFTYAALKAQDYKISFAGKGTSTVVGTVKVENLTQGKSVSLLGSDVLHLVATSTGIDPILENENALHVYPNPTNGNSTIDFVASASGKATIELFDITGKRVAAAQDNLTIGSHSYQVNSLRSGIYTIKIYSQAYTYTGKLVNNGISGSEVKIRYIGNSAFPFADQKLKNASTEKLMQYMIGDRLKFTGTSGIYSTVMTDIPTQSKTLTFTFVDCTNFYGQSFPVVQIGTQTWMATNFQVAVVSSANGINTTTVSICNLGGPYQWSYGNTVISSNLYNWEAAMQTKFYPKGWHLPTDTEWTILTDYLTKNGYGYEGSGDDIAKSLTATLGWYETSLTGTVGNDQSSNNSTGFSAIPGGMRTCDGTFSDIGDYGYWWSSTLAPNGFPYYRSMGNWGAGIGRSVMDPRYGLSVRLLKD